MKKKTRIKRNRGWPPGTRVKVRGFRSMYGKVIQSAGCAGVNGGLRQKVRMEKIGFVLRVNPDDLFTIEE